MGIFLGWKEAVGKRVLLGRGEAFCQRIEGGQPACNDCTLMFTGGSSERRCHGIKGRAAMKLVALPRQRPFGKALYGKVRKDF